jgi:hypothetical protein
MLKNDSNNSKANQIFNDIKNDRLIAAVSSLGVMEVCDVIRKRITQNMKYKGSLREVDLTLLKKEIDDRILKFLDALTSLVARDKLIWEDPRRSMEKVFAEALNILKEAFGSFGDAYECKFCGRMLPSPNYYYRGVGQYDIQ